ncbi:MAG: RNA polymerase sigma factor [Kofleriaceae bacterium]
MTALRASQPPAPLVEPTDAEVIAEVLAGERGRFAVLVKRHNQPVFRACRAVLRDDTEAEDAAQTAWLNAYRALASFRQDSAFRTWITRIAVNEASARARRQRRLTALTSEETPMTERYAESPARSVLAQELSRLLERELDALPEGLRSVLVLRDVIELDTAETAGCLGIQDENVRVRLHRARAALAGRLQGVMQELLDGALPDVWRFDDDRCARMLERVMAGLADG